MILYQSGVMSYRYYVYVGLIIVVFVVVVWFISLFVSGLGNGCCFILICKLGGLVIYFMFLDEEFRGGFY